MDKKELKIQLDKLNVFLRYYSLEGELLPDRIVLNHNYNKWEVFYFDERGNRDNEMVFISESDACNYILKHFKRLKEIEEKFQ